MRAYLNYEMPFGKFRGSLLREIPLDYLEWLSEHVDLREPLKSAVAWVIEWHYEESTRAWNEYRQSKQQTRQESRQQSALTLNVDDWYRRLSIEFHPDRRGGSNEGMKAVQRGRELLKEMLRQ